ncbi:MAG: hypothetical protein GKR89_26470 [Candidatus Latescibacteria bacterium]|nr:hypothetical protein [Candidatus Latescibacterota bacterium]
MVQKIDPQNFVDTLLPVVRQCAQASLIFFGKTANIGKAADTGLTGAKAQEASSVLTALDNAVQDIVLSVVLQHFPAIGCIAEEDTPLKRRFAGNRSEYALIFDPIDGTLHFQRGDAPYHISIGLARQGQMEAAVVARPSEDKIFTAVRGQGAYVQVGNRRKKCLRLPKKPRTKQAFISSKAREFQQLARPLLEPREHPIGAALVLTLLAEGELAAYLTRQVEIYDVGPPSLIAEEAGARCFLRDGRSPRYTARRKFPYFLAAASRQLEEDVLAIVRQGSGV